LKIKPSTLQNGKELSRLAKIKQLNMKDKKVK